MDLTRCGLLAIGYGRRVHYHNGFQYERCGICAAVIVVVDKSVSDDGCNRQRWGRTASLSPNDVLRVCSDEDENQLQYFYFDSSSNLICRSSAMAARSFPKAKAVGSSPTFGLVLARNNFLVCYNLHTCSIRCIFFAGLFHLSIK